MGFLRQKFLKLLIQKALLSFFCPRMLEKTLFPVSFFWVIMTEADEKSWDTQTKHSDFSFHQGKIFQNRWSADFSRYRGDPSNHPLPLDPLLNSEDSRSQKLAWIRIFHFYKLIPILTVERRIRCFPARRGCRIAFSLYKQFPMLVHRPRIQVPITGRCCSETSRLLQAKTHRKTTF